MTIRHTIVSLLLAFCAPAAAFAQSITLDHEDATVWLPDQVITGRLDQTSGQGSLYVNGVIYSYSADGPEFSVPVTLGDGENTIIACADFEAQTLCTETLTLTLGYTLHPEVFLEPSVDGDVVRLTAHLLDNPNGGPLLFQWLADPDNPGGSTITPESDSVVIADIDGSAPDGEYYFDLIAIDTAGAEGRSRTFVTKSDGGIRAFDIWSDHAAWVDSAVIYEVTPYNFVANGRLSHVIDRLPELREFGINTVWIQPVFDTGYGGQGYDITNYFRFRSDYGTEDDLRTLVETAHGMGLRVMLDFVPNHTSILHPYAQNAMDHGPRSHYYDFYQRELDERPYSQHYHQRTDGQMTFTYYFWEDLVNINYNNPETQRWMIEAGLRWIEDFDIDGYRIDAVWGTTARTPETMQNWRFALKRAKPEILLLGEDKATQRQAFERRFDVAYDWYPEEEWVSHWTWQYSYSATRNLTLFNVDNARVRSQMFRNSVTNNGSGFHPDAKVLRFMENNDTFRFYATHGPNAFERTLLAATILYTLHGIPMMYNGQEISYPRHPYSTFQVFNPNEPIADQDNVGLYPHYRQLIALRKSHPALLSDNYEEVQVDPQDRRDFVFAYHRWIEDDDLDILVAANMASWDVSVALTVPDRIQLDPDKTYYITDLLTGEYSSARGSALIRIVDQLPAFTAKVLALADAPVVVGTTEDAITSNLPEKPALGQNYPNPFSGSTTIPLELPDGKHVQIKLYDVVGREMRDLLDESLPAGRRKIMIDATEIPSGVYFIRARIGDRLFTRPITVLN